MMADKIATPINQNTCGFNLLAVLFDFPKPFQVEHHHHKHEQLFMARTRVDDNFQRTGE